MDTGSGIAHTLAPDSARHALWSTLACNAFVRLDRTHAFAREHPLVVVKTRELVPHVEVTGHVVGAMRFCRLELLVCGGVPCAYVLMAPRCRVRVRHGYFTMSVRGDHAVDPTMLFTDGTLGMVGDDNAVVAFVRHRFWLG